MEYEESDVALADPPTQRGKTITREVVLALCLPAHPLVSPGPPVKQQTRLLQNHPDFLPESIPPQSQHGAG